MQNEEWDGDAEWRDPRFGSGGRWSESRISWLQTKAVSPLRSATAVQIRAGLTSATGHWDVAGASPAQAQQAHGQLNSNEFKPFQMISNEFKALFKKKLCEPHPPTLGYGAIPQWRDGQDEPDRQPN